MKELQIFENPYSRMLCDVIPEMREAEASAGWDAGAEAELMCAEAMLVDARTRRFNAIIGAVRESKLPPDVAKAFMIAALEQITGYTMDHDGLNDDDGDCCSCG